MKDYKIHPIAECYPPLSRKEFEELKEHIRVNRLQNAIVLFEDKILDGVHRARACKELGIEPYSISPEISDPFAYVIGQNERRRHLDKSQISLVGEKMATLKHGSNRYEKKVELQFCSSTPGRTVKEVARLMGVSSRMIYYVRDARTNGIPELMDAINAGTLSVEKASKISRLPKTEQPKALEASIAKKKDHKSPHTAICPKEPKLTTGRLSATQIAEHEARINAPSIYPENLPLPVHPDPALNDHIREAFVDLKANEPLIPKMSRRRLYEEIWVYTQRIQTFAPGYGKPGYTIEDINPRWVQWARNVAGKVRAREFIILDGPQTIREDSTRKERNFSDAGFQKQVKEWQRLLKRALGEILFAPDEASRVLQATEQILLTHFEERRTRKRASRPSQTGEPTHTSNGSP